MSNSKIYTSNSIPSASLSDNNSYGWGDLIETFQETGIKVLNFPKWDYSEVAEARTWKYQAFKYAVLSAGLYVYYTYFTDEEVTWMRLLLDSGTFAIYDYVIESFIFFIWEQIRGATTNDPKVKVDLRAPPSTDNF